MWGLWVCYLVLAVGSDLLGLWVAGVFGFASGGGGGGGGWRWL